MNPAIPTIPGPASLKTSHADRAFAYCEQVISGEIIACKWVRLACQRHVTDLHQEDWIYRFDLEKANRVCRFIELLPHVKGNWANKNELIRLEPWQCFVLCCIFGWVHKQTGLRRFRIAYVCVPRKNAKSTIAAGIGLYALTSDGEFGAEIYSGATTEKQAFEIFRPARLMAQKTQALQTRLGVTVNAKSLTVLDKNAKFEPIIGKPGDGASPSLALIDEFHEHPDDTLLDCMVTGMGAREQPLAAIFTTAGDNIAGPCYAVQSDVQKMLEGSLTRDDLFGIVYTIDDEDDCFTETSLRKANPNYGVSVFPEFLLAQQREALQTARKQGIFKTKHLNVWVTARSGFFNLQRWNECTDPTLRIEDFTNDNCVIGLDLASVNDIAAVILLFRRIVDGVEHYYVFGRYYLPSERVEMPENRHYQGWAADGTLVATDGAMIDYGVIKADILQLCAQHPQVQEIAFDARYAYLLMQELHDATGITPVTIPQKTEFMSPAMKLLEGLILSGRIHHNGDPALTWMLSNVVAKEDANENVYPRKERDENKIDGVTALLNALARASVLPMADPTVYESSGVFFL